MPPQTRTFDTAPDRPYEEALHDLANALTSARSFGEVLRLKVKAGGTDAVEVVDRLLREVARASDIAQSVRRDVRDEIETFVTHVSHEVSEPARSAETLLEQFEKETAAALPPDAKEELELARANLGRIKRMLTGLRAFQEVRRETPTGHVDVEAVVDVLLRSPMGTRLEERGARVNVQPLPPAKGSTELVAKVLRELISNAVEHNPKPDPCVVIGGRVCPAGEREFWVRDNGPGIPCEWRERAFRLGQRGPRATREAPTAGLGLAIARRAVEAMGGTMRLEDVVKGPGLVVRFTLPPPNAPPET